MNDIVGEENLTLNFINEEYKVTDPPNFIINKNALK